MASTGIYQSRKNRIVDIVIPAYDVEEYMEECVDSAVNQTYSEICISIIDDGSPDNSGILADLYAYNNTNVISIHKKNTGLSGARNTGMDLAIGKYVYFLDSDDYIELNAIELLKKMIEVEKADFVFFERTVFLTNIISPKTISLNHCSRNYPTQNGCAQLEALFDENEYRSCVQYNLFTREYLENKKLRFLNGVIHEDELFTLQAYLADGRVAHCFKTLYHLRRRPNSIMTSMHSYQSIDSLLIIFYELYCKLSKDELNNRAAKLGMARISREIIESYDEIRKRGKTFREKEINSFRRKVIINKGFDDEKLLVKCCNRAEQYFVKAIIKTRNTFEKIVSMGYFKNESWNVAIRNYTGESLFEGNNKSFSVIKNPKHFWMADPFLFENQGKHYMFTEMYDVKKKKGCIGVAQINSGRCSRFKKCIESEYHLSYPCVYKSGEEILMLPECSESNEVPVYKCTAFPYRWEKKCSLSSIAGSDTTPVFFEDNAEPDYYLTTVYSNQSGNRFNNNLWILKSGDDEFCPAVLNDYCVRSAGHVINKKGEITRPSQNDEEEYGRKLLFNKVISFSPFKEERFCSVIPPKSKPKDKELVVSTDKKTIYKKRYSGIHTYNVDGRYEVIDLKCNEAFSVKKMVKKIYKRGKIKIKNIWRVHK